MMLGSGRLRIYDVDVLGAAGLLALGVAAWLLVILPWQRTWQGSDSQRARQGTAETQLQDALAELNAFEQQLQRLEGLVAGQADRVPHTDALPDLLRQISELAQSARLELLNVVPRPAVASGPYWLSDIQIGARGESRDFIRFLDQLARLNPYQTLRAATVTRPPAAGPAACDLSWTLRLYLLSPAATTPAGSTP
jgi:Tfp pilus assembly protein PilO